MTGPANANDRLAAHVLLLVPGDVPSGRWATTLWRTPSSMPGDMPVIERGGALQDVFGTLTAERTDSAVDSETTGLGTGRRVTRAP